MIIVRPDNETTWCAPDLVTAWQTRYGDALKHRLMAASIIDTFRAVVFAPPRRREQVCRLMRKALRGEPDEHGEPVHRVVCARKVQP